MECRYEMLTRSGVYAIAKRDGHEVLYVGSTGIFSQRVKAYINVFRTGRPYLTQRWDDTFRGIDPRDLQFVILEFVSDGRLIGEREDYNMRLHRPPANTNGSRKMIYTSAAMNPWAVANPRDEICDWLVVLDGIPLNQTHLDRLGLPPRP